MEMNSAHLTNALKQAAGELGFGLVGACAAEAPAGYARLVHWLECGHAGEMDYIRRHRAAYRHPASILDGVRSLLMVALPYQTAEPVPPAAGQARVSRYAWSGRDYHDDIRKKLRILARTAETLVSGVRTRAVVDTAPLLEREFAMLAGLGWFGKNTMLLDRRLGSWFFLAALLLDCPLEYDAPHAADYCGTCTACLDACPTGALVEPGVLDARRCISYLTIELRDAVPETRRPGIGSWLFGCDICQEVCPWNRKVKPVPDATFAPCPALNPVELATLFDLDDDAFRARFRHSALWRARRRGLLRNAAIVLGNKPSPGSERALRRGLEDSDPVVREACQWGLRGEENKK